MGLWACALLIPIVCAIALHLRPSLFSGEPGSRPSSTLAAAAEARSSRPSRPPSQTDSHMRHFRTPPPPPPAWGSYRPYVYFGMKTTHTPFSLSTGLMWHGLAGPGAGIRHETAQGELARFEWTEHDGRGFGVERLTDAQQGVDITASFVLAPRPLAHTHAEGESKGASAS